MKAKRDADTIHPKEALPYRRQRDLIDLSLIILGKDPNRRVDTGGIKNRKLYVSAAPIVEYTIATGFSPGIAGNVAFKTGVIDQTNTSSVLGAIKYTQKKQFLLPIQSSLWTPGNRYNFAGDWRFLDYAQDTYGLGGHTTAADKYVVTYKYLRLYEFALKNIARNFYAGAGYVLDYHWQIKETGVQPGRTTDFRKYGLNSSSISSGIALTILFDSRENSINPAGGTMFAKLQVVQNTTLMGSNSNWNGILIDLRKYVKLPHNNVLAFWYYSSFTIIGKPPYLDLTGTGSDTYNNTGRGYEQNRYTGKNMIYAETELRFGITRNGLLGGVVFSNVESVSEINTCRFEVLLPGFGAGLRIKFNKFSKTNACIDYGIGTGGSRGFVGNLGEVF